MEIVHEDILLVKQEDSCADIIHETEVVTRKDGGDFVSSVHLFEKIGYDMLGGGVQKVEWFIENQYLGIDKHCSDDADLLPVPHREVLLVVLEKCKVRPEEG